MEDTKKVNKGFKLFLLLFALIAVVFMNEDNQQKVLQFFNNITSKELELKLEKQYEGENLNYFDSVIVKWEENTLSFIDKDGSDKWIKNFDFHESGIIYSDKIIYAMDKLTGDIYLINNAGDTISRLQLNKPIFNIKEINNNIIVHSKGTNNESIDIIDKDGNIIENLLTTNEGILTYSLNRDSTKYVASSIHINNSEIYSNIVVNSIIGEEELSIDIPNEIIIYTEFIDEQLIILTESSIKLIDKGEIIWSMEYPLIKGVYIDIDEIYLLYGDNLEVINLKGETKSKTTFGIDYNKVVSIADYIVLYGGKDLIILDNDEEILKYKAEEDIIKVAGNNNHIALHYSDKVEIHKFIYQK